MPIDTRNDPADRHRGFNALSRDQWEGFRGHRTEVSALLGAGRGRLCVLGAGNSNDLDLPALLAAYREVHLVDIDGEALAQGAARQGVAEHPALKRFGKVDLTGMVEAFARWSPDAAVGPAELSALARAPAELVAKALPGRYEVVASTCLLSQLIGYAFHTLGERHPQFLAAVQAIRLGHLRLFTELTAPGGSAILVTDIVSSDTFPGLDTVPDPALPGLLPRLARDRNFFHGVNPAVVGSVIRGDPVIRARVTRTERAGPWRWRLHDRTYLVVAICCRVGR